MNGFTDRHGFRNPSFVIVWRHHPFQLSTFAGLTRGIPEPREIDQAISPVRFAGFAAVTPQRPKSTKLKIGQHTIVTEVQNPSSG